MEATSPVVKRWRRYGKDRLYVELPEGTKIGFWDLVTSTGHPERAEDLQLLLAAASDWLDSDATSCTTHETTADGAVPRVEAGDTLVGVAVLGAPESVVPQPMRPWVDLATNRPGAEAREQADSARSAAPVKTVLARVMGVHTDERAWRIGADGEEKVATQLEKMMRKDPRWRVLHAIPVGNRGSDIDHLIIGPGGIFTVNTKHHPGANIWVGGSTFMVDGHKQPYVRNARHEAGRAARLLTDACRVPVHVEGLIVTVNAKDVVVKSQPEGVSVIPRMQIARWLRRHGDILEAEQAELVYEAARRSTTWRPSPG